MTVPFGREFREKYFAFEDGVVELNHGSYGAAPSLVIEAQMKHIRQKHAFPNRYLRYELFGISKECRQAVSEIVDADYHDLVFTPNATTAVNAVLRSHPWQMGDKVAYLTTIYGSCRNTLRFLEEQQDLNLIPVEIDVNASPAQVEDALRAVLDEHPDAKMAFLDTVSSMPAIVFPWENMVRLCRERGVLSFVDGAHGIGLIPISLRQARPDYFTSNLHKWMYGTTSAAVLYVDPSRQRQVASLPISAIFVSPSKELSPEESKEVLANSFAYVATADYSAMQTTMELLKFRKEICGGDQTILDYQNSLAKEASELVCKELNTTDINTSGVPMAMFTVRFPMKLDTDLHLKFIDFAHDKFANKYKIFIPLATYNGELFARFSASIYLELEDFKSGIWAINQVIKDWEEVSKHPKELLEPKLDAVPPGLPC